MNAVRSRGKYTLEFRREAVRQVKAGPAASVVAKTLGMPKASLTNWVSAGAKGQPGLTAKDKPAPVITPEQAEIARLAQIHATTGCRHIEVAEGARVDGVAAVENNRGNDASASSNTTIDPRAGLVVARVEVIVAPRMRSGRKRADWR